MRVTCLTEVKTSYAVCNMLKSCVPLTQMVFKNSLAEEGKKNDKITLFDYVQS